MSFLGFCDGNSLSLEDTFRRNWRFGNIGPRPLTEVGGFRIVARFFLKKIAAQDIVVKHIAPLFETRKKMEMPKANTETTTVSRQSLPLPKPRYNHNDTTLVGCNSMDS